jgi:hypothetical protein
MGHACGGGEPPSWHYPIILEVLSRFWDLRRPVLLIKLLKDPMMRMTTAPLPLRMVEAGIRRLAPFVVQMWWPPCLLPLSRRFVAAYADPPRVEQRIHERLAARHRELRAAGVPVLLVSYADLLWRPNRTLARLKAFVPCGALRGITTDFEPVLGRDVFPGNHWKVQGTVLGFARAHPPRSLGYVNGRCANGTDSAVEAYLREFS